MPPRGRRTQVAKGAVCKTAMQRFEPARRLHFPFIPSRPEASGGPTATGRCFLQRVELTRWAVNVMVLPVWSMSTEA